MRKLKNLIRRLIFLWKHFDQHDRDLDNLSRAIYAHISRLEDRLNEHTVVHADIHWKQPHQIIVIGRYKNRDYVRVFDLDEQDWMALVEKLHWVEKNARVGRMDTPHAMSFSAVYNRERF